MATVDPFPDVNHLALSTTGCVCHGHYLVSGDTLSAVNTEQPNEATPPDDTDLDVEEVIVVQMQPRSRCKSRIPVGTDEPGRRRYCPTCGHGIGGT